MKVFKLLLGSVLIALALVAIVAAIWTQEPDAQSRWIATAMFLSPILGFGGVVLIVLAEVDQ